MISAAESFLGFGGVIGNKTQTVISPCNKANQRPLVLVGVCVILRELYRPGQTAASAPQRSAPNTCVCDGAHH